MHHSARIRILKELVNALDRRVPQALRHGEAAIALDAAALRSGALARIADLEEGLAASEPAA